MVTGYIIIRNHSIILNGNRIFSAECSLEDFLLRAYDEFRISYPKFYKMDNLSRLGFLAAELLIRNNPIGEYSPVELAVILSNSHSSLDTDRKYLEASGKVSSPALFVYTLPNIVAGEICIRHKIKGENAFFVTEKFDAQLLADYVDMLFSGDSAKACLAGWIDVFGERHDVLLYLIEKNKVGSVDDEAGRIDAIYKEELWNS